MKQHKSLFFRALFCLLLLTSCFLKPASLHAQNTGLTGLWTGALSSDSNSIRKDQSFEIALTEYKGKVYGYSRSEFIVNDTLYYILKRVKGEITGDTCEVKDDEIISYNFRGKLDKGVKVISTFYRNKVDSTWYLAGKWKTSQTKKFYSVTGKVDLEEEKDLQASKIFPHLEELKLAEDVAFYKEQKQGPVIVKIAKPERFKSEYTDLVIKNEPVQVVSVSAKPAVKEVAITEPTITTNIPVNNTKPIINNSEVASVNPATMKTEANPVQPVTTKTEIAKAETVPANTVTAKSEPVKTNTNPVQPVTIKSEIAKAETVPVNTVTAKAEPVKANTNPVKPVTIKSEIAKTETAPVNTVTTKPEPVKANPVQPASIKSEIAKTESNPVKPVTTKPEPVKTNNNPAQPVTIKSEIAKTESAPNKPVATKSEPVKTNTNPVTTSTQVNINKPVTTQSEIAKTESAPVNPVTTKSESSTKETNPVNPTNPADLALSLPKRPEAALAIDKRKSEVSQIVYYRADSLELVLYDNGEIDGDTVSVLMNNEFIFTKQGLKASAAKKLIYLPAGRDEDFTITLYAENLGKYPPNTGLLVIHDGEDTYNLRFSADYDKNARILFKRKRE